MKVKFVDVLRSLVTGTFLVSGGMLAVTQSVIAETYQISGRFGDNATISGTFDYDSSSGEFSNVEISTSDLLPPFYPEPGASFPLYDVATFSDAPSKEQLEFRSTEPNGGFIWVYGVWDGATFVPEERLNRYGLQQVAGITNGRALKSVEVSLVPVTVNINGTYYVLRTEVRTHSEMVSELPNLPWNNNEACAEEVANAVGDALGLPSKTTGGTIKAGPLFLASNTPDPFVNRVYVYEEGGQARGLNTKKPDGRRHFVLVEEMDSTDQQSPALCTAS
ncbi:MAG: hypothetical protein F6K11_17555 [Leptolyngbya sp. SIO3F4]|nr:hypothetical protein [Leptolyngbya sp. SIO3F4]